MAGSVVRPLPQATAPTMDRPPCADERVEIGLDMQAPLSGVVVNLDGLQKVRPSSLQNEFAALKGSQTVGELLQRLEATHHRLEDLRLFQAAVSEVHCGARPGEVSVNFFLKEKSASYLFGTYVNARGDVELEANAHVPAFLGGIQTFSLTGGVTPVSSTSQLKLSADLAFPRLPRFSFFSSRLCPSRHRTELAASGDGGCEKAGEKPEAGLCRKEEKTGKSASSGGPSCGALHEDGFFSSGLIRAFSTQTSWAAASSFFLQQTGLGAHAFSRDGRHTLGWETCMRDIVPSCDASRMASPSILRTPLRSLKHGLRYDFTLDRLDKQSSRNASEACDSARTRGSSAGGPGGSPEVPSVEGVNVDNGLFPRSGYVINAGAEVALPGGDARFLKAHLQGFAAAPLPASLASLSREKSRLSSSAKAPSSEGSELAPSNTDAKTLPSPWVLSGRIGCGFLIPGGAGGASVCDKFRLTGPYGAGTALRGFRSYAVGPSDVCHIQDPTTKHWRPAVDYLGGDSFLASEVCLSYDLRFPSSWKTSSSVPPSLTQQGASPSTPTSPFHPRAFLFGSVATLGDVFSATGSPFSGDASAAKELFFNFTELLRNWRGSVGWGLALPIYRGVWLEGLVALPVRKQRGDDVQRFQLGLRLSSGRMPE
ncbi:conserved hypothetical protein [Neospora caninum Liverpool]|uniref:Bacterial surface antigen (D15) domain-containing protein n=1 Tax=Neospora caninum (strain Liverpool) TaxID=572307 RepID=F0VET2_NEOCL|nr:conserved hypothetical protein [Neospora caninum Liverpool]CBZ52226.1 conserved hypothetical protein [Neospora caninum Liverpool]CEL66194.1 TPA: hypothetical protein BN1204_020120 [Neospora caninum Liverpool]|eukprot:XP_003882258.1 conserved hypothetical protein [Neospora caninum Liverpool]